MAINDLHAQGRVERDLFAWGRHVRAAGYVVRLGNGGDGSLALEPESDAGRVYDHAADPIARHAGVECLEA